MSDLISRNDAIEAIDFEKVYMTAYLGYVNEGNPLKQYNKGLDDAIKAINKLPSAEPEQEEFEWCHDCKEYDQEKHCCHRWTKVIRQTVEEVKQQYALEYPKIIHCEDCKFYTPMNRKLKTGICSLTMHHLGDEGFCSDAEQRGDR